MIDQSYAVRPGDDLDTHKLYEFLRKELGEPAANDGSAGMIIEQFPNGASNLTYRLQWGKQDLVLRKAPAGVHIKSAHDMGREYRILSSLASIYPKVPRPLRYSEDETIIGTPFYLMERVKGVILRKQLPPDVASNPTLLAELSKVFIENMADIHGLDYASTDLKSLARPGSYVQRQISGWTDRYIKAKTDDLPSVEKVAQWLADNIVPDVGASMIHNDYKYDNVILDANNMPQILAVLDWEMATIGDPLMDLGTTLGYWVELNDPENLIRAQPQPTNTPGSFNRRELVQHYALHSGRNVDHIVFYYAYGLFKIAVVVQQLYMRYARGLTTNEKFKNMLPTVQVLCDTALLAIQKNRIDQLS